VLLASEPGRYRNRDRQRMSPFESLGGVASRSETLKTRSGVVTSPFLKIRRSVWCTRALLSGALPYQPTRLKRIMRTTLPRGFETASPGAWHSLASQGGDWAEAEQKKAEIVKPKKERPGVGDNACTWPMSTARHDVEAGSPFLVALALNIR
jgi:hypothetical protein